MRKLNLLKSLPKVKRSLVNRQKKKNYKIIRISRKYGQKYFDGDRKYGYGGYKYDGRWKSVAQDIIKIYNLKKHSKILDVGCAKGFLVKDLLDLNMDAFGVDISNYAIKNCHRDVIGRLSSANAKDLPFQSNSFDFVISLNTLHNLKKKECLDALKEIQRVSKGKSFVQVDSYRNSKEKKTFLNWVLTARFHDYPKKWKKLFKEAGYTGDYNWTIIK